MIKIGFVIVVPTPHLSIGRRRQIGLEHWPRHHIVVLCFIPKEGHVE